MVRLLHVVLLIKLHVQFILKGATVNIFKSKIQTISGRGARTHPENTLGVRTYSVREGNNSTPALPLKIPERITL